MAENCTKHEKLWLLKRITLPDYVLAFVDEFGSFYSSTHLLLPDGASFPGKGRNHIMWPYLPVIGLMTLPLSSSLL